MKDKHFLLSIFMFLTWCNVLYASNRIIEENESLSLPLNLRIIPYKIALKIFTFLPLEDLGRASQVCVEWKNVTLESELWEKMRERIHGDYPSHQATKENAKKHWLRVVVNASTDLSKIERLIWSYNLKTHHPFAVYHELLEDFWELHGGNIEINNEKALEGSEIAILKIVNGLAYGWHACPQNTEAAVAFNDQLIKLGNKESIERKIQGLSNGWFGYKQDCQEAYRLNELLVNFNDKDAVTRKIEGFFEGSCGYKKDLKEAFILNESLIGAGDEEAYERKVLGLNYGSYGYLENPHSAFIVNEYLLRKHNKRAIDRKIEGLSRNTYGYSFNLEECVILNEQLIQDYHDEKAIKRKIRGYVFGQYGYPLNKYKAIELNEQLVALDNAAAIVRKIVGLTFSHNGYQENLLSLKNWIEEQERQGKRWAYYLKAQGLKYGIFDFIKDRTQASAYIYQYGVPY